MYDWTVYIYTVEYFTSLVWLTVLYFFVCAYHFFYSYIGLGTWQTVSVREYDEAEQHYTHQEAVDRMFRLEDDTESKDVIFGLKGMSKRKVLLFCF
jgi:hypothetical protein